MINFMTLFTSMQYFIFLNKNLTDTEQLQCAAFLSPAGSILNCYYKSSYKVFTMKRGTNPENIAVNNVTFIMDIFFNVENLMELVTVQCNEEIILVKEKLVDSIFQNNCSKSIISLDEFQNFRSILVLTKLEVSNFTRPIIQLEDSVGLLELYIHDNIFESNVSKSVLSFPGSLTHLTITKTDIQFFSKNMFSHLKSLNKLDLSGNKLKNIFIEYFENLESLKNLDLSENSLKIKILVALNPLSRLEIVNISGNYLKKLSKTKKNEGLNLISLKHLDLSNCYLQFVDQYLFQNTKGILHLDLSKNELYDIEEQSLHYMTELEYLNLSSNKMISIQNAPFLYSSRLQVLDLSRNRLKSINRFHFEDLTSLFSLNISFNRITNLPIAIFENNYNLTIIDLKNNLIETVDFESLWEQKTLCYLSVSQNKILEVTNVKRFDINIDNVDFSQNNIRSFPSIQYFLPQLKTLKLDYNKIKNVNFLQELTCFTNMSHSISLSLAHNIVSNFNVPKCESEENYSEFYDNTDCWSNPNSQVYLDISFNPLNCDCKLYPLFNYLKECSKKFHFRNLQNVKCQSQYFLKNNILNLVPYEAFSCLFTRNCPVYEAKKNSEVIKFSCDCGIRTKDNKTFVNCTNLGLDRVVEKAPFGTTILFFQQNKLTNLSSLNHEVWKNLTDIIVDDNDIGTLKEWIIPQKLRYLSLRGNRLKTLSEDLTVFILARDHFELLLGRNDRSCDCSSETLKTFLITNPEFVKDIEDIICNYEEGGILFSKQLISTPEYILCAEEFASYYTQTALISFFSTLIFALIAAIIVYVRMRFVIHSFLYIHCNKFCCFKSYDIDSEDKLFDAFVAYSSYDSQIVFDLLDELENKEPQFKLCIHERDWIPGQFIYENIVNSVQNSKRTIIVMSDHFIASPWFKVELNAAMSRDQMNPFIVILADKSVTLNKIDKHFHRVISKKTYLVWGERWFWEKLRYAMPHKKFGGLETSV